MIGRERGISLSWAQREPLARCSIPARLLFYNLMTIADDLGRTHGSIALLAGTLYPFDQQQVRDILPYWVAELINAGEIAVYIVRGERFLQIVAWRDLVRVDRVRGRQHPAPPPEFEMPHRDDFQSRQLLLDLTAQLSPPADIADRREKKSCG